MLSNSVHMTKHILPGSHYNKELKKTNVTGKNHRKDESVCFAWERHLKNVAGFNLFVSAKISLSH